MGKFKHLVLGGTFDLFHLGHQALLDKSLELSDNILLGITSDNYVRNFKTSDIQDFKVRKKSVEEYLRSLCTDARVEIVSIDNPYEPYLTVSADYDAIVVTPNTREAAAEINEIRRQNNIEELGVIVVPMVKAEDGNEISSTRIRNGEISRTGKVYINPDWKFAKLHLPEELRGEFKNPWGKIEKDIPKGLTGSKTIVVGDFTCNLFNNHNFRQLLSIIDFKIQRETKYKDLAELGFRGKDSIKVENPAGTITWDLIVAIKRALENDKEQVILIDGEDDLAVLPVILLAPLDFSIFYGQPEAGMVQVELNEEIKEKAYQIASKFNVD